MTEHVTFSGYGNLIELNCNGNILKKYLKFQVICMYVHMFGSVGMLEWSKKIKSEKSIWGIIQELGHR